MASYSTTFSATETPISEGGAWTSGPGTSDGIETTGGVARGIAAGTPDNFARLATPSIGANQFAEAVIGTVSGNSAVGVLCRVASGADADGYAFFAEVGNNEFRYYRISDNGGSFTYTQLGDAIAQVPVNGDAIRLEVNGSTLTAFINGVPQATRTDSTYATGQPGFEVWHATTIADATLTSWTGGDLTLPRWMLRTP